MWDVGYAMGDLTFFFVDLESHISDLTSIAYDTSFTVK